MVGNGGECRARVLKVVRTATYLDTQPDSISGHRLSERERVRRKVGRAERTAELSLSYEGRY